MKNSVCKIFALALLIWGSLDANLSFAARNVIGRGTAYAALNKAHPQLFIKRTMTGVEVAAAIATEQAIEASVAVIIAAYAAKAAAAGIGAAATAATATTAATTVAAATATTAAVATAATTTTAATVATSAVGAAAGVALAPILVPVAAVAVGTGLIVYNLMPSSGDPALKAAEQTWIFQQKIPGYTYEDPRVLQKQGLRKFKGRKDFLKAKQELFRKPGMLNRFASTPPGPRYIPNMNGPRSATYTDEVVLREARNINAQKEMGYDTSLSEQAIAAYEKNLAATIAAEQQQLLMAQQQNFRQDLPMDSVDPSGSAINSRTIINPEPELLHTGNTDPIPPVPALGPGGAVCQLPPAPLVEQPTGCGSTNPVQPMPPCEIPIEEPKPPFVCGFPIQEPKGPEEYLNASVPDKSTKEDESKNPDKPRVTNSGDEKNAQAPGMPTKEDGYESPKRWDGKKVKHEKTGKYGYPGKDGSIWIPTGHGSGAHGGPHWDVQYLNGDYDNIMPGGHRRGRRNK